MNDQSEDFQIGRVVSLAFRVLTRNAPLFLFVAGISLIPAILLGGYFPSLINWLTPDGAKGGMNSFFMIAGTDAITFFLIMFFLLFLQAALTRGTITYLNGMRPGFAQCISASFKSIPAMFALAFLLSLVPLAGFYLGFAWGVFSALMFLAAVLASAIVAVMWSVVVPVWVVERTGLFAGFARSRSLTKGHRWKIVALALFYLAILFISVIVVAMADGAVSLLGPAPPGAPVFVFTDWALSTPVTALAAVGIAAIYYELRRVKEGAGPQQLAAAFD